MRAVNLIPAEERRGAGGLAGRSGGVVYVLTGGLALLVALGVIYAFSVHSVAKDKGELASLTTQVAAVNAESQALQPYVAVAAISAEKVQQVAALAEQRFNWPTAMAQLALALPNDDSLTALTASGGGAGSAPSTSASASASGGESFNLSGCSNSQGEIPSLLTDLASVPGVTDVALASTNLNSAIKFHGLPTTLNSGGPVRRDEPASGACPRVGWTISLSYAATYTVPKVKLPQGSSAAAQTVSSSSGATGSIVQTASQKGAS
ncbi:MAG: hypothetical protein ABSB73_04680 [Solirubrobacteraceae bacterium]|jgi:Tfp pilus assembly protein PilN